MTHPLDAILVPIAHPTGYLAKAIAIAAQLDCPLVALCSQQADAAEAVRMAAGSGIELLAVDTDAVPADLLPQFETAAVLANAGIEYRRDTSAKRNLALLLANFTGWERVFFLDDDITVPDPHDLQRAAQLLDEYETVGLTIADYPDNSVVCHAFRETGGEQATFLGGGALAVRTSTLPSFFPNVYNEDWFFLLDGDKLGRSARIGVANQTKYDPYDSESRARIEEFGDGLAEGVFWLLDQNQGLDHATAGYWRESLDRRWRFITEIIERVDRADQPVDRTRRMRAALLAARHRCEQIKPALCVDYLRAWLDDGERWRTHVARLRREHAAGLSRLERSGGPVSTKLEKVLSELGLMECCHQLRRTE